MNWQALAALAAMVLMVIAIAIVAAVALASPSPAHGAALTTSIAASAASGAGGFELTAARVSPRKAYFAGRPVRIEFRLRAPAPLALAVDMVREATGKPVRRLDLPAVAPGVAQRIEWDGLTGSGKVAPGGSYRARLRAPDGSARLAGTFTLRGHIYPIRGAHADRGPIGTFGVGRSGGRRHNGFDVNAACGTKVVAARGGRVVRADYDPVLHGNVVIVRGDHTRRDYWYSHLLRTPRVHVGDRVTTGWRIGSIGATGNARTIGCHLHFEIRRRGLPIDPAPELHAWDAWS